MRLGLVIESNDAERVWNAFRLANTALDAGHAVETFLLGDGVEAPDVETPKFNPPGLLRKYLNEGGELAACGTCLDSRDLDADELRPRGTMADLLGLVEDADEVLTFG
ncbi:MAG: DsrE family protein [Halobacteriales archaeon]